MKRKLISLTLAALILAAMIPAFAESQAWLVTPAVDGSANLRSGPGTNYSVIGWAQYGDELTVLSSGGSWDQVKLAKNGKIGYVKATFVSSTKPSASTGAVAAWIVTKTANGTVNIRAGAGTGFEVIGWAKNGDSVEIVSTVSGWTQIKHAGSGKTGFVDSVYVSRTSHGQTSTPASGTGVVTTTYKNSFVNVRSEANSTSAIVACVKSGASLTILGKSGNWYQVKTSAGVVGYIYNRYFSAGTSVTATGDVYMRAGAGTNYAIIKVVPKGASAVLVEKGARFSRVTYDGDTGYISNLYFK